MVLAAGSGMQLVGPAIGGLGLQGLGLGVQGQGDIQKPESIVYSSTYAE